MRPQPIQVANRRMSELIVNKEKNINAPINDPLTKRQIKVQNERIRQQNSVKNQSTGKLGKLFFNPDLNGHKNKFKL